MACRGLGDPANALSEPEAEVCIIGGVRLAAELVAVMPGVTGARI